MKDRARSFLLKYGILRTWRSAKWRLVDNVDEWNAKVNFLRQNGRPAESKDAAAECWSEPNTYRVDAEYKKYYIHLFFSAEDGLHAWKINSVQPSKARGQGKAANAIIRSIFESLTGTTERRAFGYCDRAVISKCIPKQLYYIDRSQCDKDLPNVSKADFSSHYPASMCGRLPTWKGAKTIQGTAKPTAEYPFAFYIKSGHSAEYGVYNTHDWLDSTLVLWLFGENFSPEITPDADVTILCPASAYNYDEVIKYLYKKKQSDEIIDGLSAKTVLNAAIGYKHLKNLNNKQNRLDHLAVVTLCRANNKMLKHYRRGQTLQIVVDSIIYKGDEEIGTRRKCLGKLHQEITGARFRMRGINQYAFEKNGQIVAYAHGGFNDNIDIKNLSDIDKYSKKDITKIEK